jgi:hypothetical protein
LVAVDHELYSQPSDYSVMVDWGDGQIAPRRVVSDIEYYYDLDGKVE